MDEYERRVRALDDKAKQIPEVEAQPQKQLDRDYGVIYQHQEMLARRESA